MRLISPEKAKWYEGSAAELRDLADRVERGEITEIAVVWDDRVERAYGAWGFHDSLWRMIGALEHAKITAIMKT